MNKIIQCFKTGFPAVERAPMERTPNLPTEIWSIILEMVIRPSMITDLEFEPHQIDLFYKYLCWKEYGNQRAAEKMAFGNRRPLRLVCSLWKNIVDQIDISTPWVLNSHERWSDQSELENINTHKRRVTARTKGYIRLNQTIVVDGGESHIRIPYSHPVPTLSLLIFCGNLTVCRLASIEDLVSFPDHIYVLSLHLGGIKPAEGIIKEIQSKLTALTTLRLCIYRYIITGSLEFPTVATLCLDILRGGLAADPSHALNVLWRFPRLRNVSITDTRWNPNRLIPTEMDTFLFELLQTHIDQIESLRIHPITKEVVDVNSPICWLKMARLKALAANFDLAIIPDSRNYVPQSTSVRHLIHIGTCIRSSDIMSIIRHFIGACPGLEAVKFSTAWTRESERRMDFAKLIEIYGKVCREHNVKLVDENGVAIS
ncbi:hypothetical protein CPB86DRAFT_790824 [Serendipita vermifera]|nr:hypothetical protein CPB86DRAFT_790824 [Serendipita vermifera]